MKIALGLAFSAPNIGGVRRYIENIKENSMHQLSIFPDYNIDEFWKQKKDIKIKNEYLNEIIKNEQKIIDEHDIFHSNVDPTFIKLCSKAQQQGKKWVHTYHSYYKIECEPNNSLKNWQEEINYALFNIANKANIKISVAEWLSEYLKSINIDSFYIPNFVDIKYIDKFKNENKNFILFVGNNSYNKNYKELLTVAKKSKHTFVFIGTGLTKESIGEFDNIHAVGPLSHSICMEYLSQCSLLVINSITEGFPTTLLEAMAFMKPCLIPEGPEWSAYLFKNKEGYKYQIGNINDLGQKIDLIMNNYKLIPTARKYVLDNFSSNVVLRKIEKIYENLVNIP